MSRAKPSIGMLNATKAAKAKHHHYVPASYLARFAGPDGFLHLFDRAERKFRRQRPSGVMKIKSYYRQDWVPSGIDPNILEERLGEWLETRAKDAIDKLIASPATLSDDDAAILLAYMEMQRIRVPRQANVAKELTRGLILRRVSPDVRAELLSGKFLLTIKDSARFDYMRASLGTASPWFGRMRWYVWGAPVGSAFITSDSPISFYNPAISPPLEAGLGMIGTRVFFPLNSRHVLVMEHPEYEGFDPADHHSCTKILPTPEHKDGHVRITHGTVLDEEEVDNLNFKIALLSSHLIVAESKQMLDRCVALIST